MNVGKDPFPRDEVTGLAAFEDLEPIGSLDVVPDESVENPLESAAAAAAENENSPESRVDLGARPVSANGTREPRLSARGDATLPLDLSAMPHWHDRPLVAAVAPDADADDDDDDDAVLVAAAAAATASAPAKLSALDAMFNEAAGPGWDDEDEATRVHSHPAGSKRRGASLEMEWDEDEPATEMRPFAMFDAPPLAARHDWPEWNNSAEDETSKHLPARGANSIRSATPTIRIATPPLHTLLPPAQPAAKAMSGGRPSPFPAATLGAAPEAADSAAADSEHAEESAFEGLVPLPVQSLPVAARTSLWKSASEHVDLSFTSQIPARFLDALKAGHRPSVVITVGGFVGLLALVFIVRAIAAGSAGTLVFEVSPADVQVELDGKTVAGTSSPYSIAELTPGDHELSIKKSGYNDYRGSVAVTGGQSTKLSPVELAPNLRDVGFSVRSVPVGSSVWVDGEATDQVTPAKLTGIKPGIHRLALKHDGYADYELQMFVPEATVLQLPAAELVALPSAAPEPTRVGRRSRVHAASSDDDSYSARRSRRSSSTDSAEIERPERAERTSYTSSAGSSYASRSRHRAADSGEDVAPSGLRSSTSAAAGGKTGTLRLNSRPWSQVVIDGQMVGNTPQANLQLSAGKHKIQLSNAQLGLTKTVSVNIKAGETVTQVVNLAER